MAESDVPGRWKVGGLTAALGIERGWIDIDARLDLLGADRTHGDFQAQVQIVTLGGRIALR